MQNFRMGWKPLLTGFILSCVSLAAHAVDSISLDLADGEKVQMARVGLQWDWNKHWLSSNGTHLGGYWDLSLGQLRGTQYKNSPDATQNITLVGITPVFRFQRDSKTGLYAEGGVGAYLMSGLYNNNGSRLSTAFQFGDHIGVGYTFENKLEIGMNVQHFSNGGIRKPNDGINFVGVQARYPF